MNQLLNYTLLRLHKGRNSDDTYQGHTMKTIQTQLPGSSIRLDKIVLWHFNLSRFYFLIIFVENAIHILIFFIFVILIIIVESKYFKDHSVIICILPRNIGQSDQYLSPC